jgi:hypothetical protein
VSRSPCPLCSTHPLINPPHTTKTLLNTHCDTLGMSLKCTGLSRILANVSLRSGPLNGVVAYYFLYVIIHSHERAPYTYNHFINKDPEGPPVHRRCVSLCCDYFRSDVFCAAVSSSPPRHVPLYLPSVPTNEFVRKFAVHDMVSTSGTCRQTRGQYIRPCTRPRRTPFVSDWIMTGMLPGSFDCFARSKSESIMWPD